MDPSDAFSVAGMFKWDPRVVAAAAAHHQQQFMPPSTAIFYSGGSPVPTGSAATATFGAAAVGWGSGRQARELEEMFQAYGVRYATVEKIGDLGFTASTLAGMRDEELDDMMATLNHVFRWDLLVGERYGIKAAVRAERRRAEFFQLQAAAAAAADAPGGRRLPLGLPGGDVNNNHHILDALSQEGLSEEPVQQAEAAGSGGEAEKKKQRQTQYRKGNGGGSSSNKKKKTAMTSVASDDDDEEDEYDDEDGEGSGGRRQERQREHPFIVTEPGEVARGKKNGLDYLFHLYDQCREFLHQVQALTKERGEKCPTKVTNQVFRYAKRAGASYINKPKMRHYVHCYALHCLDEDASNSLRRSFKERGENVGAWRQACYRPLVLISARHGWDIDAVFGAHPRLAIWYVPTKLRQLCHLARSSSSSNNAAMAAAPSGGPPPCSASTTVGGAVEGLPPMFQ